MGFFTTRERASLGKSAELKVEGEVRELVRHDFAPRRRPVERERERDISGHVGTLMKRVAENSVREVDDLIAKLKRRREQLLAESERVQRQIAEYAQMSQSTMQSTKIISESLASFNKVPDAPRMSVPGLDDMSNEESRDGKADIDAERERIESITQEFARTFAQDFARDREDDGASEGEAEAPSARTEPRSEAT
jgi:hypothetical protein